MIQAKAAELGIGSERGARWLIRGVAAARRVTCRNCSGYGSVEVLPSSEAARADQLIRNVFGSMMVRMGDADAMVSGVSPELSRMRFARRCKSCACVKACTRYAGMLRADHAERGALLPGGHDA